MLSSHPDRGLRLSKREHTDAVPLVLNTISRSVWLVEHELSCVRVGVAEDVDCRQAEQQVEQHFSGWPLSLPHQSPQAAWPPKGRLFRTKLRATAGRSRMVPCPCDGPKLRIKVKRGWGLQGFQAPSVDPLTA